MHKPIKYVEKGATLMARGAWTVFNGLNKIKQRPSFTPTWSDRPLLKSYEKTKPPLGWPRETDSPAAPRACTSGRASRSRAASPAVASTSRKTSGAAGPTTSA